MQGWLQLMILERSILWLQQFIKLIKLKLTLYKNACITYTNLSNWGTSTEYVWSNPSFHNHFCFDTVLLQMPDGQYAFACIHQFLEFKAAYKVWNIALVTLFKTIQTPSSQTGMHLVWEDLDSSFIEVRSRTNHSSGWIDVPQLHTGISDVVEFVLEFQNSTI